MFLAVDIGNTAIKFGIFDGDHLLSRSSIPAKRNYTNDEIIAVVDASLDLPVERAMICSVVPELDETVAILIAEKCGVDPVFVRNDMDFGLKINYEPLSAAGADRLVTAFAASQKYGAPCIVCSLGTAMTVDAVNSNNELVGGIIAPGMETMAKALHANASRLPEVSIAKPPSVIANNTFDAISSGVFYGQISMIDGLVGRILDELGEKATVIATGGFAAAVEAESSVIDIVDENLLLDGLNLLAKRLYTDAKK